MIILKSILKIELKNAFNFMCTCIATYSQVLAIFSHAKVVSYVLIASTCTCAPVYMLATLCISYSCYVINHNVMLAMHIIHTATGRMYVSTYLEWWLHQNYQLS